MATNAQRGVDLQPTRPDSRSPGAAVRPLGLVRRLLTLREGSIVVVTLITILYFVISVPDAATANNARNLLPFFAPFAIMAAGEVFVMTLGEIDLSVGSVFLFVPFVWNSLTSVMPIGVALVIALLIGVLIGAINGFFIAYVGIGSFVVTLGTLFFLSGLTLVISSATQIQTPGTSLITTSSFDSIFGGGTYAELLWAIGIVIILQILLSRTRWGIYTVAVGGNRYGAAEAGIPVRRVIMRDFMLCAFFAALVGIFEAIRVGTASPDPSGSDQILFEAISAVIIGGTVMTGGEGTVVGALIGALFLGVLNEGLVLKGVSSDYEDLYLGLAIIVAMVLNIFVRRARRGSGRGG